MRREILGLGNNLEDVYRDHPVKALRCLPLRNSLDIESETSLKIEIKCDLLFQLTLLTPRFAKMRLERIEKLGVEMIEILPQVVQRNISKRHLQQYMLISWFHVVTSTFHSDTDETDVIVFQIDVDVKGQSHFQTFGISSLSDSESRWFGYVSLTCTMQAYMDCYELCLVQNEKEIAEIFANRLKNDEIFDDKI